MQTSKHNCTTTITQASSKHARGNRCRAWEPSAGASSRAAVKEPALARGGIYCGSARARAVCARCELCGVRCAGASGVPVHPHTGGSGRRGQEARCLGARVDARCRICPGAFVPARGHVPVLSCCPFVLLSGLSWRVRVGEMSLSVFRVRVPSVFRVPCACPPVSFRAPLLWLPA